MRRTKRNAIEQLRMAIDCLPVRTREAMLQGLAENEIVVGAYSTRDGGVCPMLAAHRCGGRTSFISFARAWDRFAHTRGGGRRARRATERELRVLRENLEASLARTRDVNLGGAIAEHRELVDRRSERELKRLSSWSWLKPSQVRVRRRRPAARALARVERAQAELVDR